nr:ribosomal rna large subunit methyltransferase i [Quercus suber]
MQHISARLIKSLSFSSVPGTTLQEIASSRPKGVAKVVLKKGKTQLFKDGSPMVYSGAVDRIIGRPPPRTGDIVLVADGTEKPIGWGLYNSVSMFCVRLMQLEEEATRNPPCALNVEKLLEARIDAARELRKSLGLPSANTNAYRLVNSEGDRLSGLIVDVFGDLAVIASSAAWVEKYKQEIEACISRIDEINHINWRPSVEILKEEGINLSDLKEMRPSACPERTKVMENGIFYAISLEGQKTGFYADQRENRQFISTISDGQKVLDICCYSGGFALNAARGGAVNVTGLIVDVFGDLAVIASSAAWVEKYKQEIEACISRIDEINHINWRPSVEILKEEGINLSDLKEMRPSACPERTKVMENGIFYAISLEGQKTGFYADQRENRQFISTISDGQKVLDICCYSGGFALNAARGGAVNVTGVDTSLPALELAKENIVLNNMDPGRISFLREDAAEFMKGALSKNESWDVIIVDPPKLAPRKKVLQSALGMYRTLNSLAMQLTKKGGLLMTCSCSGAMTQSGMFLPTLQGAASMAGRKITVLRQAGAACDHPVDPSYPEGAYLSNILLRGAASMAGRKITVLRQAGAACDHPVDPSYPEGAYLSNILLRVL